MRTTINLDPDIERAVERLRTESRVGLSEAVNQLARRGLLIKPKRRRFEQRSSELGITVDLSNLAEALEVIERPTAG